MAHVIAISNQKGGVAKTTTSVNLAACLGAAGYRALLVDMDPQGNATSAVGLAREDFGVTVYQSLVEGVPAVPVNIEERVAKLHVLASDENLAGAEIELLDAEDRNLRLRQLLAPLRPKYDYIVIDSPPSLSVLALNVLCAADRVVIPVQAEFLSLEGLARILHVIDWVQEQFNPKLKVLGILVTLFDGRTRLSQEVLAELENRFGDRVFKTRIPRTVRLSEAPSHGLPIIYYDFHSTGSEASIRFCEEVLHACQKARAR